MQQTYSTTLKVVETILSTHKLSGELVTKIDGIPLLNGMCDVQILVRSGKIVACTITNGQSLLSGEDAKKILYEKGKLSLTLRDIQHTFGEEPKQSNVGVSPDSQALPYASNAHPRPNRRQATDPPGGILPPGQPHPYGSEPNHQITTDPLPDIQPFDYLNHYGSGPNLQTTGPLAGIPRLSNTHPYGSEADYQITGPWPGISAQQLGAYSVSPVTGPNIPIPPVPSQAPTLYERSVLQKTISMEIDISLVRSWPHWQRQIFLLIDGNRTVEQILSLVSKDQPERVIHFLQELLSAGYIRIYEAFSAL
jgi:hypothetical protein